MILQTVNSIPRTVLLTTIREHGILTPKPAHMMKTEDLLEFLPVVEPISKKKSSDRGQVKQSIIDLHLQGMSGAQIKKELPQTHPAYIYTVLSKYKRSLK